MASEKGAESGDGTAADRERFVSKGAAYFDIGASGPPHDFYFLLLPKMTMLAFSAALEPLRIANQLTGKCLYRWFLLSEDGSPVRCSNGVSIVVDGSIGDMKRQDTLFVCSGVDGYLAASARAISWLREQSRHGRTIGGLCTGAFSLARAGLLEGKRFTLHWENQPAFEEIFPNLPITSQLYCRDGNIITCGGGDASVDMVVALIENHHGAGLASKVADMCLHGGRRVATNNQRISIAAEIGLRDPALARILETMQQTFADDIEVGDIADQHAMSRRQLERLFQKKLGISPGQKLREIRLDHAHCLMTETNMSIPEIAAAAGFRSYQTFRNAYRARFGAAPAARFRLKVRGDS
jgi:AraC family transcriptional regulator, carnitine catabolism transcriptional activator